jgi:hypothetical protein
MISAVGAGTAVVWIHSRRRHRKKECDYDEKLCAMSNCGHACYTIQELRLFENKQLTKFVNTIGQ